MSRAPVLASERSASRGARSGPDPANGAGQVTLVQGGLVEWQGGAILIAGRKGSGTSTLVTALVRRGARYHSDCWVALDDEGLARPILAPAGWGAAESGDPTRHEVRPLRVVLAVVTSYRAGAAWDPLILHGARAVLPLLDHIPAIRDQPARALRLTARLGAGMVTLASPRPEAERVVPDLLKFASSVLLSRCARRGHTAGRRPGIGPGRATGPSSLPAARATAHPLTTYVVGGMPRSGTSMMMRALGAGGVEIFADPGHEARLSIAWAPWREAGYHPNPHGCHEPGEFWSRPEFPDMIRGRLVKLMGRGAAQRRFARIAPIRVAFIHRDRQVVARSHLAVLGGAPKWTESAQAYRTFIRGCIEAQRRCPWVQDVTSITYEDVIRDPLGQFSRLADIGWPIDPRAAAATIDPALDRHGGSPCGPASEAASID